MRSLTIQDVEMLRTSILEGKRTVAGRTPLQCFGLADAPSPNDIEDIFSPLVGDVWHAMNRPSVGVKHEAKKGYFVAYQNAFYVWNEEKLGELKRRMEADDMSKDDIDSLWYYNRQIFISCVEREVPPPSILYWRVRAVFALYGNIVDSKTNKPLFNAAAWAKANNILTEIRLGYYSDPPGISMYTKKLKPNGSVKKNKYGMEMIECICGTNRTEAYHKNLAVTFGSWHTGVEMSDCLLSERRHRHNHRASERRRSGFPKIGHYDTWLIDQLQILVLKNHGHVLYPN